LDRNQEILEIKISDIRYKTLRPQPSIMLADEARTLPSQVPLLSAKLGHKH
jgi:hypothetical protein